jgi:SdrD B-like domain
MKEIYTSPLQCVWKSKHAWFFLFVFSLIGTLANAQTAPPCTVNIGGKVFNDFNNNGVLNTTDSLGFAGIKVYAFNCAGVKIDSAVTDSKGNYVLTKVTAADDSVRIEFVASSFPAWAKPTYNGTSGRTDVQFVKAPSCNVNLGMVKTTDYCQTDPDIVTACFVAVTTLGSSPAIISFKLSAVNTPAQPFC